MSAVTEKVAAVAVPRVVAVVVRAVAVPVMQALVLMAAWSGSTLLAVLQRWLKVVCPVWAATLMVAVC